MLGTVGALDRIDDAVRVAVARLRVLPGVRRVGLALSEGGGRRLRFTASDRDDTGALDWCHIDAYDDVPLNQVLRTGEPVLAPITDLHPRFAAFAGRQLDQGTAAIAAVPVHGRRSPAGAFILFYGEPQAFDAAQRSVLEGLARELAEGLRVVGPPTSRPPQPLAAEPAGPGSRVADLVADGSAEAVGDVRRWARACLRDWGVAADRVDDALLCLSELAANAVMHTEQSFEVRLVLDPGALTVTVRDRGAGPGPVLGRRPETARQPEPDPLDVHGRGLQLVEALSSSWHVAHGPGATTVHVVLGTR